MQDPMISMRTADIRIHREETIEDPPSFEQVMQEVAITILVCLLMALAAELLTRGLAPG